VGADAQAPLLQLAGARGVVVLLPVGVEALLAAAAAAASLHG
jgi:hypothetical protein